MRWPAGTGMLPISTAGAATREPSAACVHTVIPTRTSVARTGPPGVSIMVDPARQIGQLGGPEYAREPTATTPSTRTVRPTISYAARPVSDWTRYWNPHACRLYAAVNGKAFSSFH